MVEISITGSYCCLPLKKCLIFSFVGDPVIKRGRVEISITSLSPCPTLKKCLIFNFVGDLVIKNIKEG
jgi:hypothetical protein